MNLALRSTKNYDFSFILDAVAGFKENAKQLFGIYASINGELALVSGIMSKRRIL